MKITFFRQGHANNSSSSHSIIYTKDDISDKSDEASDFGWQLFTCSSKEHKQAYCQTALYESFQQILNLSYNYDVVGYGNNIISEITWNLYTTWYREQGFDKILGEPILDESYIDHDSIPTFPSDRHKKILNAEFARRFCEELVNNNYAILGGNDNDNEVHSLQDLDTDLKSDFKVLWKHIHEAHPLELICQQDKLTGEFVISEAASGNLIKIEL